MGVTVVCPFTVCVSPLKSPPRSASVGTVPVSTSGVVLREKLKFKKPNCLVLGLISPGRNGEPASVAPKVSFE